MIYNEISNLEDLNDPTPKRHPLDRRHCYTFVFHFSLKQRSVLCVLHMRAKHPGIFFPNVFYRHFVSF